MYLAIFYKGEWMLRINKTSSSHAITQQVNGAHQGASSASTVRLPQSRQPDGSTQMTPGQMKESPGSIGSPGFSILSPHLINPPPHLSNPPPYLSNPQLQPFPTSSTGKVGSKEEEDTMKNLRKTFAGIFGDM